MNENFLKRRLLEIKSKGLYRELTDLNHLIDFSSNDYLGLSQSSDLKRHIREINVAMLGATGSRLISGNSIQAEELEQKIARFHQAPAGLLFNSGFDANSGLLSSLLQINDSLIYDESIHASMHDGMKLSEGLTLPFRHNDLSHLEKRLQSSPGEKFVATESVFSMDGSLAPLEDIAKLCSIYGAHLIVDEAHATGVYGPHGSGRVCELNLQNQVFARIHTFGKALGFHGAIVLGDETLRHYLINKARTFIYSTALPPFSLAVIDCIYEFFPRLDFVRNQLFSLIEHYRKEIKALTHTTSLSSTSPIQGVLVPGNNEVVALAQRLRHHGFAAVAIRSPTVRRGQERLRVCLHAHHTREQINRFVDALRKELSL